MLTVGGWILTAGLMLGGAGLAGGQGFSPPGQPFGGASGQAPPEMAEMQKAQARLLKEEAPEFYAYQEKLRVIDEKIGEISASLARKEIDKATAKENMLPLIKEQQEIQNDPVFLVEQRLTQAYFSSPEYREKVGKIMAAFAEKQKRKAQP